MAYLLRRSTYDKVRRLIGRGLGARSGQEPVHAHPADRNRLSGIEWSCSLMPDGKTVQVLVGQIVWGSFAIKNGVRNGQELPPYYYDQIDVSSATAEGGEWICVLIHVGAEPHLYRQNNQSFMTFSAGVPLVLLSGPDKPAHDPLFSGELAGHIYVPLSLWRMRGERAERLIVAHVGRIDLTSFFLPPM